jgi:hypothetical protein
MGMFDKWFGGKQDYPPLPADNEAMAKLDEMKAQLEELAKISKSSPRSMRLTCISASHRNVSVSRGYMTAS